ncbi:hypothetical protein ACFW1A_19425 [Kitasatospora sp. NPDC058965]|uniref:hypothetical protein n=1 Tax=Kitasatospora sp. NPDC058965 TaxID=3346682 RepID=UPI00369BE488
MRSQGGDSQGPAGGFTVDQATLTAAATALQQAAAGLATVSGSLADPPAYVEDVYGEYGAVGAAQAFIPGWQDELQVDHDALADLADRVRQSAANYGGTDGRVAQHLRGGRVAV